MRAALCPGVPAHYGFGVREVARSNLELFPRSLGVEQGQGVPEPGALAWLEGGSLGELRDPGHTHV